MQRGRSFLILLVLALGVGAYAYFESKRDPIDTTTKKPKVFTTQAGKIEEIEVHSAAGAVTKAKKSGEAWQIVAPEPMDADPNEIGTVVSTLESLEAQRTVDEAPSSAAAFGLAPARFTVAFKMAGDATTHQINLGNKTAAGADLYAQVEGQPKVFLVSSYIEDSLNRSTFDLREKSVLKFSRDGVDLVTLEAPGAPAVALTKKGPDWLLTKPVEAKADFGSVDTIVTRIAQSKMKALVTPGSRPAPPPPVTKPGDTAKPADAKKPEPPKKDEKPVQAATPGAAFTDADLKAYGLDKPQVVATVGAGSTRASIAIGGKFDETTMYARDLSRPMVFTVEKALADDLKKKADDLRIKDVFEFRGFTATAVELTSGGTTFAFEKQKTAAKDPAAGAAEVWKQTKPSVKDVDQTKLNDLLTALSNLRADKFADKPLASGEDLGVVAKFGEAGTTPKEEHVTLRKSGTTVQAIHPGEAGPAIVPTAEFDKILVQVKELVGIAAKK